MRSQMAEREIDSPAATFQLEPSPPCQVTEPQIEREGRFGWHAGQHRRQGTECEQQTTGRVARRLGQPMDRSGFSDPLSCQCPVYVSLIAYVSGAPQKNSFSFSAPYSGAPGEIRTPNPQIRSLVLYPIELRAPRAAGV